MDGIIKTGLICLTALLIAITIMAGWERVTSVKAAASGKQVMIACQARREVTRIKADTLIRCRAFSVEVGQ